MNASTYLQNFLESKISFQGNHYSRAEIDETVIFLKKIISDIQKNTECYLQEKDPLTFSILFFLLLEKNCPPIPLMPEISSLQKKMIANQVDRAFISNGEVQQKGTPALSKYNIGPYYICTTSGSTGTPKECYLTLKGAVANATEHASSLGITTNHTVVQNLPLQHSFGIIAYLMVTAIHRCALDFCPIFLTPKNMKKRTWINSVLHCSSSQLKFMLKDKDCIVTGVTVISFGAGVVSSDDVLQLKNIFPEACLYVTYGLTELGPRVTTGEITMKMEPGYIGFPFSSIQARVFLEDSSIAKEGIGLLALRSPSIKTNIDNAETVTDGESIFYLTKDRVNILPTGEIYFLARSDDLIKVGGISVYPIDIEDVAKRFEGIHDAIAFPIPHNIYGDVPVLFVEGLVDEKALETFLSTELTPHQMPKKIFAVETFPRISINKIDRKTLKEKYLGN